MEPMVCFGGAFSDEEVTRIVALCELIEFGQGMVGGSPQDKHRGVVDEDIRITDVAFVEPSQKSEWLYKKMGAIIAQVNHDKYQFDLEGMQPLQYTKYKPSGHYNWHVDAGPNLPVHRKLSVVLGLSDPSEYEGGDFELNHGGDHEKALKIRLQRGQMIAFPSWMPHRVTPVTSGQRLTLVGWVLGPRFR